MGISGFVTAMEMIPVRQKTETVDGKLRGVPLPIMVAAFYMEELFMSLLDTYRRNVTNKRDALAKLSAEKARESDKIARANKTIVSAEDAIHRTKSASTIKSKTNDISRANKDIADANRKISEINKKIARLEKELTDEQKKVEREETKLHDKRMREEAEMQKKTQKQIDTLNKTVKRHEDQQSNMQSQIDDLKKLPEHITVLFLAVNPKDTERLRLDEEARDILEMIRKSDYRDTITFEPRLAVRTFDLLQAINEVNPDIIHFSGHGSEDGKLVFENRDGEAKLVSKEAMVQTISTVTDRVRFMFFNACFSSEQAEEIVKYVDAAIGMTDSIGDEAARVFASNFYSAVGFGKNIKVAYEQARAALMLEDIPEENTPVLYVRDGLLDENLYLVKPDMTEDYESLLL